MYQIRGGLSKVIAGVGAALLRELLLRLRPFWPSAAMADEGVALAVCDLRGRKQWCLGAFGWRGR